MTGFLPPPPRAAVEAVLADLVTRGLLSAQAAAGAGDPAGLPPLGELGVAGSLPAFVSSFGPRNLTVLNQLYGATLGDLAAEVVRAVVAAVAADAGAGTRAVRAHGPDVLVLHGESPRADVEAFARRGRDVLAGVALPAGAGLVHLRPLVATVELRPSARYSTDELLRTLHEARQLAGRSDEGVLFLGAEEAQEALGRLRAHDERLAWVTEALSHGRVEVHFQPVVDLRTGRLADVEALARIPTPRGLLAAGEFIDDVHRLGETAALDGHVMRRVGESAALSRAPPPGCSSTSRPCPSAPRSSARSWGRPSRGSARRVSGWCSSSSSPSRRCSSTTRRSARSTGTTG